jgi:hypothetical protein
MNIPDYADIQPLLIMFTRKDDSGESVYCITPDDIETVTLSLMGHTVHVDLPKDNYYKLHAIRDLDATYPEFGIGTCKAIYTPHRNLLRTLTERCRLLKLEMPAGALDKMMNCVGLCDAFHANNAITYDTREQFCADDILGWFTPADEVDADQLEDKITVVTYNLMMMIDRTL